MHEFFLYICAGEIVLFALATLATLALQFKVTDVEVVGPSIFFSILISFILMAALGGWAVVAIPVAAFAYLIVIEAWIGPQAVERREAKEREKEEQKRRTVEAERESVKNAKQEELARAAEEKQKSDYDLSYSFGVEAGKRFQEVLPKGEGQLYIPVHMHPIANKAVAAMCDVFWDKELTDKNIASDLRDRQRHGAETVGSKENPVWPKDYKGKDPHKVYLPKNLWPLFDQLIPFSFLDRERFTHHWCKGAYGAGKTTFLSHLIKHDLGRVAKEECSLIVMDSKKLVREMRTMKVFAPGGSLDGRLIIIDGERPFPLNPLRLPKSQAVDIISYALAGIMEATDLQADDIAQIAAAACAIPNATLDTIRDFFLEVPKGTVPFDNYKARYDADTLFYLEHVFAKLPANTKQGILRRIMGLRKSKAIRDMFNADHCINLFDELHDGGKVLLVDTNTADFGEDGTHVLGRLIICMVEQLSVRRTKLTEARLKPIWFVIDEAHDYIHSDPRFAKILEKARAQKIGVTVAHHHDQQIDRRIEASLAQAGVRSVCERLGEVSVTTRSALPLTLPIQQYSFINDEEHMSRPEYKHIRDGMAIVYPYKTAPTPPPKDNSKKPTTQKF